MSAMPPAKISLPRGVVAPDTGSVTMKKAASMAPPLARWNSGEAKRTGSNSQKTPETRARVPMKAAGMCQVIVRVISSRAPPAT